MNLGSEPADQMIRFSLEGTEVALKLSGLAAKNFALFVYAVLRDQKKTRGKTHLVRMLKEQRPLKFFTVPSGQMREFAQEAKKRGLLFVPIRNRQNPGEIELAVFADDAAKVSRVMDRLNLDFVKSQAGGAAPEHPEQQAPVQTESVPMTGGPEEFTVGGLEDDFSVAKGPDGNFTPGREGGLPEAPGEGNLSGPSSPDKNASPGSGILERPSVRQELREIRREQRDAKGQALAAAQRSLVKKKSNER